MNRSIQNNIAILLTCHNRKDKTLQCLDALYACDLPNEYCFDVYLVDDGSTDGTAEAVSVKYPKVKIIKGTGNLYWNRGMHLAWQSAVKVREYDFYLWLNDDTILFKESLNVLIETSNKLVDKAIVVGCTVDEKNECSYGGRNKAGLICPNNEIEECTYFNGNIVLIPNYVFKKVGFNDAQFHHSLGDFDYGLRAKKMGIKSYIAPKALGVCNGHDTIAKWCNPKVSFGSRWKAFRTPLGHNPEEYFIFEYRHNGLILAIYHYFTNHLRVLLPQLWIK